MITGSRKQINVDCRDNPFTGNKVLDGTESRNFRVVELSKVAIAWAC